VSAYGLAEAELAAYLGPRMKVLEKAAADRDGDAVVAVIEMIRAEGRPDLAEVILDGLLDVGLRQLVGGSQ